MNCFDKGANIIRNEADKILSSADTLDQLSQPFESYASLGAYDLRRSAKNLREAADKLDRINTQVACRQTLQAAK